MSEIFSVDFMRFSQSANQCMSLVELKEIFDKSLRDLGFDAYVFSLVRSRHDYNGHFILNRYPVDWANHYRKYDYMKFDPVYRLGWEKNRVFNWASIDRFGPISKAERRLMDEAGEAGLRSGATVSIHVGHGRMAGFSFASSLSVPLDPGKLSYIYALAGQFQLAHERLSDMPVAPPVLLSERQAEVLKWAAAGKSRGVTADIMNISEAAVDDHFRRIFKKLNCNDKVVAVLRAVASGIIHV